MEKTRYKAIIQYDGTHFSGFQIQPDERTIQGDIEKALKMMSKGHVIKIQGSGRTDAGVHALGQVIHFDYPTTIPPENMKRALNSLTTDEIGFFEVEIVPDTFHARYQTSGKKYEYRVDTGKVADPFKRQYTLHHPYPIHLDLLEHALAQVVGKHDFSGFCASRSGKEDKVRTVYEASVRQDEAHGELIFTFAGDGFLYNMVRILVGTLLQIANGRRDINDIQRIIASEDRNQAGPTASPKGLYLMEVYYQKMQEKTEK
ncbi:tRNA pseudouridine(38-40) synthase TruA [Isobaculum melis]|uniref:tRNA pseudouridine synthase A n=1 Tax=Isobaculum melis TaxID=142588 RepID=A0A1H9SDE3_9LACT|nr:tRNA pseudouridine(38-40) synthase TruA [Isobaculum melis]SER82928.1 tRNA pseudouridine38-40 synthase [Isobaculum melis]